MTVTKQVPTVGTCNELLVPTDELTLAALVAITGSWCCSGGRPRCIRLKGVHVQRLQSFSLVELLPPSWAHTVGLGRLLWRLLQLSVYVSWAHSLGLHFLTSALTLAGLVIGRLSHHGKLLLFGWSSQVHLSGRCPCTTVDFSTIRS